MINNEVKKEMEGLKNKTLDELLKIHTSIVADIIPKHPTRWKHHLSVNRKHEACMILIADKTEKPEPVSIKNKESKDVK